MKHRLEKTLLIVIALIGLTTAKALCESLTVKAAKLTQECKKRAEKTKQLADVLAHLRPEAAGRAQNELKLLAEAGARIQEITENGAPQDPEQAKVYIAQLEAASDKMTGALNSVQKAFDRTPNLADKVLAGKLGLEQVQKAFDNRASTMGSSGPLFDGQPPDESIDQWVHKSLGVQATPDTDLFGVRAGIALKGNFQVAPREETQHIKDDYKDIPGGIVLESAAQGIEPITKIVFDGRSDAFIVNDKVVYFVRVPRKILVAILKAIALDDKMGVSLSTPPRVYGALPKDSPAAWNLMLADNFLGSISFAELDWLHNYKFANNYHPQEYKGVRDANIAAFFRITGIGFQIQDQIYKIAEETLEARAIPLRKDATDDGRLLPSYSGSVPHEWQANIRHIADNIGWYRREKLIDQMFASAEAASFLRAVRNQNIDLNSLASQAEAEITIWNALH